MKIIYNENYSESDKERDIISENVVNQSKIQDEKSNWSEKV